MNFYESKVDWDKADCRGMDVNFFYFAEEKRLSLQDKRNTLASLRSVCTACPIWQECLTWGFANEDYGVWGGMIAAERKSFTTSVMIDVKHKTISDFNYYGISYAQIKEAMPKKVAK
jgi:hypothetical protein